MSANKRRGKTSASPVNRPAGSGGKGSGKAGGFGVWIVLGIVAAAVVLLWKPVMEMTREDKGQKDEAARSLPEAELPGGKRSPDPDARSTKPAGEATALDDKAAERIFERARGALLKTEFVEAQRILAEVEALKLSPEVRELYQDRRGLVDILCDVDQSSPVSPESRGEELYTFKLANGQSFRGRIESESLESLTIVKDNGIKVPMKRSLLASQVLVGKEARRAELKAELKKRQSASGTASAEQWQLASFAFRSDLREEARDLLRDAWKNDPNLAGTIFEGRAKSVLREWLYFKTRDIPSRAKIYYAKLEAEFRTSQAMKMANEILAEEGVLVASLSRPVHNRDSQNPKVAQKGESGGDSGVEALVRAAETKEKEKVTEFLPESQPAGEPEPVDSTAGTEEVARPLVKKATEAEKDGKGGSVSARADKAFDAGMSLFGQGAMHPDPSEGREMISRALENLAEAEKLYMDLLSQNPGNAKYEERLSEVKRKQFWAGKFRRVS